MTSPITGPRKGPTANIAMAAPLFSCGMTSTTVPTPYSKRRRAGTAIDEAECEEHADVGTNGTSDCRRKEKAAADVIN